MGYNPWGHRKSDTTKGLSTHASLKVFGVSQKSSYDLLEMNEVAIQNNC